jgi:hypothetical protein
MEFGEVVVALAVIGSVSGLAAMLIDKLFGGRDKRLEAERMVLEQRLAAQEQRLAELERHNDQLEQALVWHRRLAESQGEPSRSLQAPIHDPEPAVRVPTAR